MELIRRLDRNRFDIAVVVFEPFSADPSKALGIQSFILNIPPGGYANSLVRTPVVIAAVNRLRRYFVASRPHIVHSVLPAASIIGTLAARSAAVPAKIIARRSLVDCYRAAGMIANLEKLALSIADAVVANSSAVCRELLELDRIPRGKVTTVYNGVDTARFQPADGASCRRELGWAEDNLVLGMVANFFPYKRHIDFADAADLIHRRFPFTRFLMVGRDAGALAGVRRQVERHRLGPAVAILPEMAAADLYPAMDVCVSSSETEGFSNVLLEAMSCAKPVIATDVGGNREAVEHAETGFLVPARSPREIAVAAEYLIQDDDLRVRMGLMGRERVKQHFSIEKMVQGYEQLYCHLAASNSRVAPAGVPA